MVPTWFVVIQLCHTLSPVFSGSLQHLWDGWWSFAWPLLSGHVLPLGQPYSKSFSYEIFCPSPYGVWNRMIKTFMY